MTTAERQELETLRELVGVRKDAPACAADAQHWLKLMAAWDDNVRLRAKNAKLCEALERITKIKWGWDGDCGAVAIAEDALG
jgi:hypothetical protein